MSTEAAVTRSGRETRARCVSGCLYRAIAQLPFGVERWV